MLLVGIMRIDKVIRPFSLVLLFLYVTGCGLMSSYQTPSAFQEGGSLSCNYDWQVASIFATEPEIKEIQARLILLGYPAGEIDGVVGENTRNAIRSYQAVHKLLTDGRPSTELLIHIKGSIDKHEISESGITGMAR